MLDHTFKPVHFHRDFLVNRRITPRVAKGLRSGDLIRLVGDWYVETATWTSLPPWQRVEVACTALMMAKPQTVFCGSTATHLFGLPSPERAPVLYIATDIRSHLGLQPETFIAHGRAARAPRAPRPLVQQCREPFDKTIRILSEGYKCVPLIFAVIQVAVHAPFYDALATIDAVLGAKGKIHHLSREELLKAASVWPIRTQAERAETLIRLGDGKSESPRESRTRGMLLELGAPIPEVQHRFDHADGTWHRGDLWLPHQRVLLEYDGWDKLLESGDREAFRRERLRHEKLMSHPDVSAIIHLEDKDVVSLDTLAAVLRRYGVPLNAPRALLLPTPRMISTLRSKGLAA